METVQVTVTDDVARQLGSVAEALSETTEALASQLLSRAILEQLNLNGSIVNVFSEAVVSATRAFGTADDALEWLLSPNLVLGGDTPFAVLRRPDGLQSVQQVLGRMEHGVYS